MAPRKKVCEKLFVAASNFETTVAYKLKVDVGWLPGNPNGSPSLERLPGEGRGNLNRSSSLRKVV
jgi:hypothetical protein